MLIAPEHWHPVFVHFTFALLFLAPIFLLLAAAGGNSGWTKPVRTFGRGLLWSGVIVSLGTVTAGFIAMMNVDVSHEVHENIDSHRNWALATGAVYGLLGIWAFVDWRRRTQEGWLFVCISLAALGMLGMTGYKGGDLVFEHGVSVGDEGHEVSQIEPAAGESSSGHNHDQHE